MICTGTGVYFEALLLLQGDVSISVKFWAPVYQVFFLAPGEYWWVDGGNIDIIAMSICSRDEVLRVGHVLREVQRSGY